MLLLVGLGNPNPNNSNNRHNVGFRVIDAINSEFKFSKQKPKFKGLSTTGKIDEKKIFAIKPLTFMNNSGTCIKELIDYFKINVNDVFGVSGKVKRKSLENEYQKRYVDNYKRYDIPYECTVCVFYKKGCNGICAGCLNGELNE